MLKNNIWLSRIERNNNQRALEFKEFNLKIKAWTVLMKYFTPVDEERFYSGSLLDLSKSQVQEYSIFDLAEHKRMSTLFNALRSRI